MELEKISALGSEGAPDTGKIEKWRFEKLNEIAAKYHMSLEDLNGIKDTEVRDSTGPYPYPVRFQGKINGVEVDIEKKGEVNKRTFHATLNGIPTNEEDAYAIWGRLSQAVCSIYGRNGINEKAKSQTFDTLTDEDNLAELKYENEVGSLRDTLLGRK